MDGKSTNPGDLSWKPLEALGELTVYDDTSYDQIVSRAKEAEAVILNRCVIDRPLMSRLPRLRFLGTLATGYNSIDTEAARERGIPVCNVPDYCTSSVAQHAFSLLLSLCGRCESQSRSVKEKGWETAERAVMQSPIPELFGKTFGILGFGDIGQAAARIALAFSMEVIFYNRSKKDFPGCTQVSLPELFQRSDVLSIHCPLTDETRGLVDKHLLFSMKPTALLINTARGAIVREKDLAQALNEGRIAGAGVDVLSQEPPAEDHPLLHAKNCILTPHIAWSSKEARQRLIQIVADNLKGFLSGETQHVVNP